MPDAIGIARPAGAVGEGLYRYTLHDDRIDFQSDSYLLVEAGQGVLLDPLPVDPAELTRHGPIRAIVLSASCHERAAWRYRDQLDVPVWAPEGGVDFEGTPDRWYRAGDRLPGGLVAVHAPGPTEAHYAFYCDRGGGVVLCADLLTHAAGKRLAFVPDEYQDEPERTRESVRRLLDLDFTILCTNHGHPLLEGAKDAIRELLARDKKSGPKPTKKAKVKSKK